jgi:ribonuclease P protein subunit RPR2
MPRRPASTGRRGRLGRRTALTVQVARERIRDLFVLAAIESDGGRPELADRYVALARKVGTRYNVRLPGPLREMCCRACSSYWVEGRSVRTRLRAGVRVRTCLACGAVRRTRLGLRPLPSAVREGAERRGHLPEEPAFVEDEAEEPAEEAEGGEAE